MANRLSGVGLLIFRAAASAAPVAYPVLTPLRTIAADAGAHLRDPSSPIFDPADGLWHVFCTRVALDAPDAPAGYSGRVVHYYSAGPLDDPDAAWNTSGVVVANGTGRG